MFYDVLFLFLEKSGTCPKSKPGTVGICIVECGNDYECKGNWKCCGNPCGGGVCVPPVEETPKKSGTCPKSKPGTVGICIVECGNDYECKGNWKCCENPCGGGVCVPPVEETPPKWGTCPAVKLKRNEGSGACVNECSYDSECPEDKKCCSNSCGGRRCTAPVESNPPKPGNCPAVEPGEVGVCAFLCSGDGSCDGNKKCCSNGCGGTECREPEKPAPKPGTCPVVKLVENLESVQCVTECFDDGECPGEQKCCSNSCGGGVCTAPVESKPKPGKCPAVKPGEVGVCAFLCSGDGSCEGNKKCCKNGCGGTQCREPEKPARKPGTCPATPPGPSGASKGCSLEKRCRDDFSCPGKKLCCRTSCGGTACVSPVKPSPCSTK